MTGHDHEAYISEAEAASILHRSDRQVRRYARTGKVMSEDVGGVRMYLRADVEALATDLRDKDRTRPARSELVPMGDVLEHLARKDDEIRELNDKLQRAMHEIGRLQAKNEAQQRLLTVQDSDRTRPDTTYSRHAPDQPAQPEAAPEPPPELAKQPTKRVPWWRRLFAEI
jgi:hypothetical protein